MMAVIEIKNRYTDEVICMGETIRDAVMGNLADLRGADLRGADLRDAILRGADLRGANLRGAILRDADLRDAILRGADLLGANLRGADLRDAILGGAKIAWQSHDLLAELLRRSAGDDVAKLKVAGLVLVCREKCWKDFLGMDDPLASWALGVLRPWAEGDENAPECLRKPEAAEAEE